MRSSVGICLTILGLATTSTIHAENWPQWRGPQGNSHSNASNVAVRWDDSSNNVTKVKLPEWGTSTPAIWDDAVFLTSEADGQLLLIRIDSETAEVDWTKPVGKGIAKRKGEGKRSTKFHNLHNLASPSPITDGERVVVHFGNGLLASYRFDGSLEWERNLVDDFGEYTIWWGHANSPVFYGDLVISVCMQDPLDGVDGTGKFDVPNYVVAHDKRTGKQVWKTARYTGAHAEEGDSYTTPVFHQTSDGPQMIIMGGNVLDSYDPRTGEKQWSLPGLVGGRTITGPTLHDGIVYTTVGMRGPLHAIEIPKQPGTLSESNIQWKITPSTPDTCCPVVVNGLVFIVTDNGIASCLDAETGKQHWRERLPGGNYKASPIVADGNVYFLSREGHGTIIKAAKEFQVVAKNKLDDEFVGSPAVADGTLYLRGKQFLYMIRP
ncbi:outer membrane protein assembly factor BamB family protein [Thalassoroseus pseudoceratinae]|uniref:outer membrane protein assembly factor BamB family protein n=1 Tax=Thalassoroseus pseudoceratinae TaxID=2713176 RepID=UPI0014204C3B|nr:PQQ-binding-like beta-propeller repeat protein [Thalassoroseus pseudoceratinae]